MTGYEFSRQWHEFADKNPELVKPGHGSIMFYIVDLWNRIGKKEKFELNSGHTMRMVGIKSYNTYIQFLRDLVFWTFLHMVQASTNQHTANIIALSDFDEAEFKKRMFALSKNNKAADEALFKNTGCSVKFLQSTRSTLKYSIKYLSINNNKMNALVKNDEAKFEVPVEVIEFLDSQDDIYKEKKFRSSFADFLESRHESGRPVTLMMAKKLMGKVQALFQDNLEEAIRSLDQSALSGWPDVYRDLKKLPKNIANKSKQKNLQENFKFKRRS